jgi:maleylacetate reductase
MPLVFAHDTLGQRMLFGTGLAAQNVAAEIERLGAKRVMTISPSSGSAALGDLPVALAWHDVVQHVPVETAEAARAAATDGGIDLVVSVGGGSTTGLAKAIALTTGIPIVAVPTTYSGSEATNVWGLTENARKTTGVDARVLPVTVVYDAALTLTLPVALSVASGFNGIAHCIDSLWAPRADPINAALATEGIRALASGLRLIHADATDVDGREQALYGAYLAAVAFASAGSGMHHKICHVLGGTYALPHAETHATVLPYVTAFTVPFAPDAERRIAQAFDSPSALEGLNSLRFELGAPTALRDYGFTASNVAEAASFALPAIPASHPRPVSQADLERLLSAALDGVPPTSELFTAGGAA